MNKLHELHWCQAKCFGFPGSLYFVWKVVFSHLPTRPWLIQYARTKNGYFQLIQPHNNTWRVYSACNLQQGKFTLKRHGTVVVSARETELWNAAHDRYTVNNIVRNWPSVMKWFQLKVTYIYGLPIYGWWFIRRKGQEIGEETLRRKVKTQMKGSCKIIIE